MSNGYLTIDDFNRMPTREDLLALDKTLIRQIDEIQSRIDNFYDMIGVHGKDIDKEIKENVIPALNSLRYKMKKEITNKHWNQFPDEKLEVLKNGLFGHKFYAFIGDNNYVKK